MSATLLRSQPRPSRAGGGPEQPFTSGAHLGGDLELSRLTADRRGDHDRRGGFVDEARFFLPLPDHVNGEARVAVALADHAQQLLVDPIARLRQSPLILLGWIAAIHHTEVRGAGTNV